MPTTAVLKQLFIFPCPFCIFCFRIQTVGCWSQPVKYALYPSMSLTICPVTACQMFIVTRPSPLIFPIMRSHSGQDRIWPTNAIAGVSFKPLHYTRVWDGTDLVQFDILFKASSGNLLEILPTLFEQRGWNFDRMLPISKVGV